MKNGMAEKLKLKAIEMLSYVHNQTNQPSPHCIVTIGYITSLKIDNLCSNLNILKTLVVG